MKIDNETELFIRKFIHELRNPLTALYSTLQFMEVRNPELKEVKYWPTLQYNVEDMISLINNFSALSKAEDLVLEEFDQKIFFQRLCLSFAASIADSEVEFTSKINIPYSKITRDKSKLQEVFLNLLKNAYEATLPNGQIFFEVKKKNDRIVVLIKDTGCGMDEEQLAHIFEPFVTYKKNGTGLGLAICKQIIEAHGGTISAASKLGVGTTFSVEIPA